MNNRDRLVELLEQAEKKCYGIECEMCKYQPMTSGCFLTAVADHLIANGVDIPVRCGECKYNVANMHIDENDITDYSGIDIVCSYHMSDGFDADDYCSYGKRKECEGE